MPAIDPAEIGAAANGAGRISYVALCAGCHGLDGNGIPNTVVAMRNNSTVRLADPRNLVVVMLDGIAWRTDGSGVRMPAFAQELSDRQVATLGDYLTQHFGDPAATVTVDQVRMLRAGGPSSNLVLLARIGLAVAIVILITIIVAIVWALLRRRRALPSH